MVDPPVKRRKWPAILGVLALAAVCISLYVLRSSQPRPNILLVTLDTTRADRIGCYNAPEAYTPRLDALAAKGVLFERSYAPIPVTLPSHASMLTGLWPPEHGLITNGQSALQPGIPTAAEILSANGYATAAFTAAFVLQAKFGLDRGFEVYDDDLSTADTKGDELHRSRDGRIVVDAAANWLSRRRRQKSAEPFFCWVHLYDPHHPYIEHADEFGTKFSDRPYDGEIAYIDRQIGRLLDALDENGMAENTTVIIVGDHGESLGEHGEETHGYMLHDSTLRVPLIIADPHAPAAGRRVSTPVSLVDIFATLLTVADVDVPPGTGSLSLAPALEGGELESRFCYSLTEEPYLQAYWSPLQGLTTERWRYIRTTKPELYDLTADPGELENLAASRPDVVEKLEAELSAFEKRLERRIGSDVPISEQERRELESLGYTGGQRTGPAAAPGGKGEPLPDIKDMIAHLNQADLATELIEEEKFDEAAAVLEPLARDVPNFLRARLNLGLCRLRQQNFEDAAKWFESALEIDPNSDRAHDMLGFSYLRLGKLEPAMKHFLAVLELRPDSETAHLFLGEINQRRGNLALARQHYLTALQINPQNAEARIALEQLSR